MDAERLGEGEISPGQQVAEQQSTDESLYTLQRLPQRQGWQQARLDGRTREYALQGGVSICARDMVKECRRCGKVICRVNFTVIHYISSAPRLVTCVTDLRVNG